jgi:hypothetical protein
MCTRLAVEAAAVQGVGLLAVLKYAIKIYTLTKI